MKKILMLVVFAILTMPLTSCMKIINTGEEGKYTGKVEFNATDSVSDLWVSAVEDIQTRAVYLPDLLTEAKGDLKSVVDDYGKYSMGTSGTISYPVSAVGEVVEVENSKKAGYLVVKLDEYNGSEIIKIQIGSVYKGSSTRDNLTIINFGDYTNQEEWAEISKELNAMIDKEVIAPADIDSILNKKIDFTGTFEVKGNDEILITPVILNVN
ncbi:MAG: DUF2291 domain-containing protein [Lachnospirales bacterium]